MQSLDLELWWRRQRSGSVCAENILSSWWFHMISFSTPTRIHERPQFFWKRQQHLNKTNIPEKQCSIQKKKETDVSAKKATTSWVFFPLDQDLQAKIDSALRFATGSRRAFAEKPTREIDTCLPRRNPGNRR